MLCKTFKAERSATGNQSARANEADESQAGMNQTGLWSGTSRQETGTLRLRSKSDNLAKEWEKVYMQRR